MGGLGSTRWNYHTKKQLVEDCLTLHIKTIKECLAPGFYGWLSWTPSNARINYQVTGEGEPEAVRLIYTITDRLDGVKTDYDYSIPLTYTLVYWGARRYWFTCPLSVNGRYCGRRVGVLYLPPGGRYFGCRHCYNLTYRSAQEAGKYGSLYKMLAESMQGDCSGITAADLRYMFERDGKLTPPPGGYIEREYQAALQKALSDLANYDPYADYLTAAELCERSGLTAEDLAALESARLLLPDHGGRYRPKLAGWGRKLATLLREGWNLDELKAWARGRWSTPDPRRFPPDRAAWGG